METDIYKEHGFENRRDYLESLAVESAVPEDVIFHLADLLGPEEDFDGLINAIEDCTCFY